VVSALIFNQAFLKPHLAVLNLDENLFQLAKRVLEALGLRLLG
jgi:hypothetical protein